MRAATESSVEQFRCGSDASEAHMSSSFPLHTEQEDGMTEGERSIMAEFWLQSDTTPDDVAVCASIADAIAEARIRGIRSMETEALEALINVDLRLWETEPELCIDAINELERREPIES